MRSYSVALILVGLLALSGCATQNPKTPEVPNKELQWTLHQQAIAPINGWQISGKLGVRAPKDSGSATLFWLQRQDYFDIQLTGPLAIGSARLSGRLDDATLALSNQGRFQDQSAEALLQKGLGWRLPLQQLTWWVRGLPAPDLTYSMTLNDSGTLRTLAQTDWQITYVSYTDAAGITLPERIRLQGADLQVTLVIKEWQPRTFATVP